MAGMENIYDILAKENEESRQVGIDYSKIREGGVAAAVMAQAGGMLGGSVMQAAGFKTAAQKTQEGREQLQQMHPNPTTYQDMVAMANDAKNLGLSGDWELIMKRAEAMNDTKSTGDPYLLAKRKRNEKAVELQQAYGPMESLADKKAFKRQLIESGVGDSTVFTSITGEINTLTAAGLAQEKDTDTRQEKLAIQMTKNGVPDIESALVEFERLQTKFKNDLPGIGLERWSASQDAKDMRSAFKRVKNMVLKERSGAAVTNAEFERLLEEVQGTYYTNDDDAIRFVSRVRSSLERIKRSIFSGYGDRVKKAYWDTGTGVKMYEAPKSRKKRTLSSFTSPSGNIFHNDGVDWFDNNGNKIDISKVK